MSNFKIFSYVLGIISLFILYSSFFTVDQTKQAIVLQFGEPKRVVNDPGLNFKIPFVQEVTFFEKGYYRLYLAILKRLFYLIKKG